jgi:hypothetical protein
VTFRNLGLGALVCVCLYLLLFIFPVVFADAEPLAAETAIAQQDSANALVVGDDNRTRLSPEAADTAARAGLLPANAKTILKIRKTLKHGEFVWNDHGVPDGDLHVWVDLRRQTISVFRAGHEIGSAVIAYGTDDKETPRGTFAILSKHRDYRSRMYDADMPYSLFINNEGIALHSSALNPRHATHGCVGLPDAFAKQLFSAAQVGTVVDITSSDAGFVRRFAQAKL